MTAAGYLAWLQSTDRLPCILIEAGARSGESEITRYFSDAGYVTGPAETPANTNYRPLVAGGINLQEKITYGGVSSLSTGDIELHNQDGGLDTWFFDVWTNRPLQIFHGDKRWPRADFQLIFDGIISDAGSRARGFFNLKLRDKMQRLNTPVSEKLLGGLTSNSQQLIPVCLGDCHNISPLLIGPDTYQVHGGPIEAIVEVRDEGVPVSFTADLQAGTFTLTAAAAGVITASVQGAKPGGVYRNDIAGLVQNLVENYGLARNRLTDADIDLDNFAAFAAAHPQPVGDYQSARTNVIQAIQGLAASIGAEPVMTRRGQLRLIQIALPPAGQLLEITASDMVSGSFQMTDRLPVVAGVQIGYCENWTIQANLLTGIPPEHKALFAQQYLLANASNAKTASDYRLFDLPVMQPSALVSAADAQAEADRRLALQKEPRSIYQFVGFESMLALQLGQGVLVKHFRYGMEQGRAGVVIGLTPDYLTNRVTVEIIT